MLIKTFDLFPLPHAEDAIIKYVLKQALMDCLDCNQLIALIALIHRWSETVDKEGGCVRSLADCRKAVDLIDHNILYAKPLELGLKTSILNSISDFLRGRRVKLSSKFFSD
jgi:hypothetical protein